MTEFELVQPIESHARQILQWRNDPVTLQNSLHRKPKVWESFFPSFLKEAFQFPELPQIFILEEGVRVAHLRFDPVESPIDLARKCCAVSINVAPEHRGKKVGQRALLAIQPWLKNQGMDDLLALIRAENEVSHQVFEKAGFKRLDQTSHLVEDIDETALVDRYHLLLTPQKRDEKVFIIAEAGSNWCIGTKQENWQMACRMIEAAKAAGADAIKFQTFQPDQIYVPNAGSSDYLSDMGIREDIFQIFERIKMPHEVIPKLFEECKKAGIEFMSSTFSPKDFAAVDPFVKRHKIASYEIGHIHLLQLAAKSRKPLLLSTGASTEYEIAWAVEIFHAAGGKDLTLLQCTACYPAEADSLNLNAIPWLKKRFKVRSGLSDHSSHPVLAPVAAVALGAKVIEKHFPMDRSLPGPDHAFAITAAELKEMVQAIREVEVMGGPDVKVIHPSELELRAYAKRGIQAIREIKGGERLREGENIAVLRPGKQPLGIHPRFLGEIEGKKAAHAIKLGEGIQKGDWC
jgi:sialic acid synthase SpsE/RimJ/RimL family protein N-acetyltransferase